MRCLIHVFTNAESDECRVVLGFYGEAGIKNQKLGGRGKMILETSVVDHLGKYDGNVFSLMES